MLACSLQCTGTHVWGRRVICECRRVRRLLVSTPESCPRSVPTSTPAEMAMVAPSSRIVLAVPASAGVTTAVAVAVAVDIAVASVDRGGAVVASWAGSTSGLTRAGLMPALTLSTRFRSLLCAGAI
ncbi:hypothetical protein TPAR_00964 [Tolypocladium paradoxum]|uniref:Uncharacterized protein n=1 Tax=Tolypocladium paradoxum TaxID=94208 RepID=A0A2S4L8R0_9HYPO|nr:hypothetical protein TPAR_00964 [Tolypocladium paradoxum]